MAGSPGTTGHALVSAVGGRHRTATRDRLSGVEASARPRGRPAGIAWETCRDIAWEPGWPGAMLGTCRLTTGHSAPCGPQGESWYGALGTRPDVLPVRPGGDGGAARAAGLRGDDQHRHRRRPPPRRAVRDRPGPA